MDTATAKETFLNPPMGSRAAPLWFWNDRLDAARLIPQFDALLDAGCGGAILHSRTGQPPEGYLTPDWFGIVRTVTEHAAERGASVWLYDELGWPSGMAGGRIPGDQAEFRMLQVHMTDVAWTGDPGELANADVVAAFLVTREDPTHGFQRRPDGFVLLQPDRIRTEPVEWPPLGIASGERLLVFHRVAIDGVPNYLDSAPTAEFIRVTHEAYLREVGEHFGKTIRHIFMDEPGSFADTLALPWSLAFEREFEQRRGYSLLQHLPALFFETPGHEAVRFDYWTVVAELFREGWAKPLNDWCNAHGILLSGHFLHEATLKEAMRNLQAPMPLYEHEGFCGVDVLGRNNYSVRYEQEVFGYYTVTIKQAASAVSQLGKRGLMSESYGVGGNAMGPEAMQIATNWQMAHGVTFLCHHAPYYSIRGERKIDCPPCLDWRQPWWPFARKYFDSLARTGWLLALGETVADVLLLHPAASMEATYRLSRTPEERKVENYLYDADLPFELIDKHFTLLTVALSDAQIGFEYGDEELMAWHGSLSDGRLRVGAREYGTVVLPPLVNIRATTVELLREFMAHGGSVIAVGSLPELIDGRPSREAIDLLGSQSLQITQGVDRFDYGAVVRELTMRGQRSAIVTDGDGNDLPDMKVMRRLWDGRDVLYVANISQSCACATVRFTPSLTGRLELWDASNGSTRVVCGCHAGVELEIDDNWWPGEASILVTVPEEAVNSEFRRDTRETPGLRITPQWAATRNAPNVLILDECYVAGAEGWPQPLSISQARQALAEGIYERASGDAGPEVTLTHGKVPDNWQTGAPTQITTRYTFEVAGEPPHGPLEIALELGEDTRLSLNGLNVPLEDRGAFLDEAIRLFALPPLRSGTNSLEICATYREAAALQAPMLLGEFALSTADNVEFTIGRASEPGIGVWGSQGLPFYHGTVTYRTEVGSHTAGSARIELPGLLGSAQVRVNGIVADNILWQPYHGDIMLAAGTNVIEVEVAGTLRNLLGPLYEPHEDRLGGYGERSYTDVAGTPKRFHDYGLTSAPEVVFLDPST